MDKKELKQLMKEAAREVFQEEMKEILLEAVRSPKIPIQEQFVGPGYYKPDFNGLNDNSGRPQIQAPVNTSISPEVTKDIRNKYMSVINETAQAFINPGAGRFNPAGVDPVNGELPQGELGMDQIMNLMGKNNGF